MMGSRRDSLSAERRGILRGGLFLWVVAGWALFSPQPLEAQTNYVFFSVNGDTSAAVMVQGDTVGWGTNCDVGGTVYWSIVYDTDTNGVIEVPGDLLLVTFPTTDGDTSTSGQGLPDINPVPDGWCITPPLILGVAPGYYLFEALSLGDSSRAQRPLQCEEMPFPPNTFSGQIVVPGHPSPDTAMLSNRWVQAEEEDDENQIWMALTNCCGAFSINVGAVGTGHLFRVGVPDIPGFVAPDAQMVVASGHMLLPDFVYGLPVDSLWGYVLDEHHDPFLNSVSLYCYPTYGSGGKDAQTQGGRFVFYFADTELGSWTLAAGGDGLIPQYLKPEEFQFDNTIQHAIRHDLTCIPSDTVMHARVTEGGGPPAHSYRVRAEHSLLGVGTHAVSGTGHDNVVTLHISSLGGDHWSASIDAWYDDYPLPPGYILGMNPGPIFGPGDTVDLEILRPFRVSDTIKGDPDDPVPLPGGLSVVVYSGTVVSGPTVEPNGSFTLEVMSGWCTLGVDAPGYFTHPPSRDLIVTQDTAGGLGFQINQAHGRVHGVLSGVSLPLSWPVEVYAHSDASHPNHQTWAAVDMFTGEFDLYLCDGEWTLTPPQVSPYSTPDSLVLNLGNAPDTLRIVAFDYTPTSVQGTSPALRPADVTLYQNHPNPFNPGTAIRYYLPEPATVTLSVYNVLGMHVRELANGVRPAGEHVVTWDGLLESGAPAAAGLYVYRLTAGGRAETRRMLLLR